MAYQHVGRRSPHAHALIRGIDTRAALAVPGVVAILTGPDIRHVVTIPSFDPQYFNNLWTEKGNTG
jgi:CO/xanthine dehydrogenase Mo-binding subunit